jgi:DNA topoisomerase-3
VTEESKPTTQISPLLYDLTSLQREANGRFGLSAKTTLSLAQALYERHKVLTYPRTDSRHLPEDYIGTVKATLEALKPTQYGSFAKRRADERLGQSRTSAYLIMRRCRTTSRSFRTSLAPKHLNDLEAKIYDMVTKRFLAIFHPAAEFLVTTRITRVEEEPFKSEGKVMVNPGWLAVYGRDAQAKINPRSSRCNRMSRSTRSRSTSRRTRPKPPPRFTEATLLSAMEGAGKLVEDEDLREAMSEKGLGTPATRASIIEGLIYEKYVHRNLKELQPTAKAFSLITLLRGLGIPELSSPELTGDWEFKLRQMEHGALRREEFMREIAEMTRHIVGQAKAYESDTVPGDFATLSVPCPKCGGVVKEITKSSSARIVILPCGKLSRAGNSKFPRSRNCCRSAWSGRCRVFAASWAGPSMA